MANALPLIILAGGAALLLKKKKKKKKKPAEERPSGETPSRAKKVIPTPAPTPGPVPGNEVEPGEIMLDTSTMTKNYGSIGWRIRRYAGGAQYYVEIYDPDDGEYEVATTNRMEDGPVRLFTSIEEAGQWTAAFIKSVDEGRPEPEPEPIPVPRPPPPPPPEPEPQPQERGEAFGLKPGTYSDVDSYARYGLVAPYRTPATTVSVRRKSGMVWYPAKQEEARFVGWNPQNSEEALVDVDTKGEYSIIALDGGPNGVFIAEWILKATQG